MVGVAQLVRVSRCDREGWEFESPRSPIKIKTACLLLHNIAIGGFCFKHREEIRRRRAGKPEPVLERNFSRS